MLFKGKLFIIIMSAILGFERATLSLTLLKNPGGY